MTEDLDIGFIIRESSITNVAEGDWIASVEPVSETTNGIWIGMAQSGEAEIAETILAFQVPWGLGDSINNEFLVRRGPHIEVPQTIIEIVDWEPARLPYAFGSAMADVFAVVPSFVSDSTLATPMAPSALTMVSQAHVTSQLFRVENARGLVGEDFAAWNRLPIAFEDDSLGMGPSLKDSLHATVERYKTLAEISTPYPWHVEWQGSLMVHGNDKSESRSWRSKILLDRLLIASADVDANKVISDLAMGMLPKGMLMIGNELDHRYAKSDRSFVPDRHFVAQATLICDDLNLMAKIRGESDSDEAHGVEEDESSSPSPDRSMGILLASCVAIGVQFRWRTTQSLVHLWTNGVQARVRRWLRPS